MMKKVMLLCLLWFAIPVFQGCKKPVKKTINWSITLQPDDKNPYGSSLAYESLKHFFPGASVKTLSKGFRYSSIDTRMMYPDHGTALLILDGLNFRVSEEEFYSLQNFARSGNEIILFGAEIDNKLEQDLHFYKGYSYEEFPLMGENTGDENKRSIYFADDSTIRYGYRGRTITSVLTIDTTLEDSTEEIATAPAGPIEIESYEGDTPADTVVIDTVYAEATAEENESDETIVEGSDYDDEEYESEDGKPEILGYANGQPNIVRYKYGPGHITIHAAPLVTSNYFLLQKGNIDYLQRFWNFLPEDISYIYWNSYFKRTTEHSDFGILWRHPATRWALMLSILALALYVLLEMKRRQRPIPIVKPLENTSVTFVETVGRLYYNKGNHQNLAEKMVQHFLEWVRTHYYLNTNQMDNAFVHTLTAKSGLPMEVVHNMVEMIQEVRIGNTVIDEPYLYHLNTTIQRFQKK